MNDKPDDQSLERRQRVRADRMFLDHKGIALERDDQPKGVEASTLHRAAREGRSTSPAALIAALKRRQPSAFEQLLAQHGAKLYRVALGLLGQRQDAEEVLQETWLRVYEGIHAFREHAALPTWLYRIVVNASLVRMRTRARRPEAKGDPAALPVRAAWALSPEEALLRQELRTAIQQGIDRLPELYRAVYVLAELEGRSYQELATVLALTVGTVKSRLHRARRLLRAVLVDEWGAQSGRSRVDRRSRAHRHCAGRRQGVCAVAPLGEPITT